MSMLNKQDSDGIHASNFVYSFWSITESHMSSWIPFAQIFRWNLLTKFIGYLILGYPVFKVLSWLARVIQPLTWLADSNPCTGREADGWAPWDPASHTDQITPSNQWRITYHVIPGLGLRVGVISQHLELSSFSWQRTWSEPSVIEACTPHGSYMRGLVSYCYVGDRISC
jgi:hypothetical protein